VRDRPPDEPTMTVLAPSLFVSITIEDGPDADSQEIHLHAGGQGVWVARMARTLGECPVLCAPLGGESGRALTGLVRAWELDLDIVRTDTPSPSYVHDRRSGERREIARSAVPQLNRHEVDDLYGRVLERALATGVCVITGRFAGDDVPTDFYRRLGADLAGAGVTVVGDLHGSELDAFLEPSGLRWLKVSEEDLREDGRLPDADDTTRADVVAVLDELVDRGAEAVLLSRSDRPALAMADGRVLEVAGPTLEVVDHSGAGDSMTAALAVAAAQGMDVEASLRLAWAAGAANVTRHGLGSADRGLIHELADRATITEVERP
jgi:1-phosphofructokinase